MSQIGTSSIDTNASLMTDQNSRNCVFFVDTLNYHVVFWADTPNIYYSFSTDNGLTWSTPISITNDATSSRFAVCTDSSNNIYVLNKTYANSLANINLRYKKLTYTGSGTWTQSAWKPAYSSNYVYNFDMIVDSNGRIWIALLERNTSTLTFLDTIAFYSDDNGENWSSHTTIKVSGGVFNIGIAPSFGLRNGKPVVVYGNGTNSDFCLREWTGSAWGSEQTTNQVAPNWGVSRSTWVLTVGTTNYIVYTTAYYLYDDGSPRFPEDAYIVSWNGTSFGTAVKILSMQGIQEGLGFTLIASTNGSEILVAYRFRLNRKLVFPLKYVTYNISTGKVSNQIVIDSSPDNNPVKISRPQLPASYVGYPLIIYAKYDSGTKILSKYFSKDYGIKIAKDGQDVTVTPTEANKKNFIIMNTVDAHKLVYAGFVTSGSYNHGLGFPPFCDAFEVDSASNPTWFKRIDVEVSTTQILGLPNPSYIILYREEM